MVVMKVNADIFNLGLEIWLIFTYIVLWNCFQQKLQIILLYASS